MKQYHIKDSIVWYLIQISSFTIYKLFLHLNITWSIGSNANVQIISSGTTSTLTLSNIQQLSGSNQTSFTCRYDGDSGIKSAEHRLWILKAGQQICPREELDGYIWPETPVHNIAILPCLQSSTGLSKNETLQCSIKR